MTSYDPRITPARPDLAASKLAGKVEPARFVDGHVREIAEPQAPLRRSHRPMRRSIRGAQGRARHHLREQ